MAHEKKASPLKALLFDFGNTLAFLDYELLAREFSRLGGRKLDAAAWRLTSRVGIGPLESGGFGLAAALELDAPEIERDEALDLMRRAHEICPYSRATRGNIEVTLSLAGRSFEDQAA